MREGWVETTLGEVADLTIGRTPPRNDPRYWTGDLERPFCTIADMDGRAVDPKREGVTELAERAGKAKRVPAGSLLMSFKLTIGRVGFATRDLFPNEAIVSIKPKVAASVGVHYLALALASQDLEQYSGRAVKGKTLTQDSMKAIPLSLPPLEEQRRIVDLIASADSVIEGANAVRDQAARTLLPLLRSLVPADAEVKPLRALVRVARAGGTPSRKEARFYGGGVPWLKSGEVVGAAITTAEESITADGLRESAAWLVPAGAVVVAMYGATAGQVGQLGCEMATNQAVLAVVAREDALSQRFLYHWLRSRGEAMKARAIGAAQPNLSKERVLDEPVPMIPVAQQGVIASAMDGLTEVQDAVAKYRERLDRARACVLDSLLSGSHTIPDSYDRFLEGVA